MLDKVKICFWSDGTWCHEEELPEYSFMSDDYSILFLPAELGDEDIVKKVEHLNSTMLLPPSKATAYLSSAMGCKNKICDAEDQKCQRCMDKVLEAVNNINNL